MTELSQSHFSSSGPVEDEESADSLYTISSLAKEFRVTTRAIRFYEAEGLLNPSRNGRQRIYSQRDRTRLKLILRGKRLGFSLTEIREIFDLYDSEPGEAGQLQHVLAKLEDRKRQLQRQFEDLRLTLQELEDFEAQCQSRLDEMQKQ